MILDPRFANIPPSSTITRLASQKAATTWASGNHLGAKRNNRATIPVPKIQLPMPVTSIQQRTTKLATHVDEGIIQPDTRIQADTRSAKSCSPPLHHTSKVHLSPLRKQRLTGRYFALLPVDTGIRGVIVVTLAFSARRSM